MAKGEGCSPACPEGQICTQTGSCIDAPKPLRAVSAPSRSWTVMGRIGNVIQSVNVFANNSNDARVFASRQVPGFSPTSVAEFNACTAGVGSVINTGITRINY